MLFSLTWLGYILLVKMPIKMHNRHMRAMRKAEAQGKFDGL
jgi:hypothetical protein